MSVNETRRASTEDDPEQALIAWLREHPDFFSRHPAVLEELQIPHRCGEAVSLVEHQVGVLRDHNRQLRRKIQELIQCARDNEDLSRRLHRLTLALISCSRADDVFATLQQALCEDWGADAAVVRLFARPRSGADAALGEFAGRDACRELFAGVLESGRPACGRLKPGQLEYLFAERAAHLASAALLPLGEGERYGVLAIGSRDPQRFHPGMGTVFLRNLGEVVTRVLAPHVELA